MKKLNEVDSLVARTYLGTRIFTAASMLPPGLPVRLRDGSVRLVETVSGDQTVELLTEQNDPRFADSGAVPLPPTGAPDLDPQHKLPNLQTSKQVGKGSDPTVRKTEQIGRAGIARDQKQDQKENQKENQQLVDKLRGELGHEMERKLHQQLGDTFMDKKSFEKAFSDFARQILAARPTGGNTPASI